MDYQVGANKPSNAVMRRCPIQGSTISDPSSRFRAGREGGDALATQTRRTPSSETCAEALQPPFLFLVSGRALPPRTAQRPDRLCAFYFPAPADGGPTELLQRNSFGPVVEWSNTLPCHGKERRFNSGRGRLQAHGATVERIRLIHGRMMVRVHLGLLWGRRVSTADALRGRR